MRIRLTPLDAQDVLLMAPDDPDWPPPGWRRDGPEDDPSGDREPRRPTPTPLGAGASLDDE